MLPRDRARGLRHLRIQPDTGHDHERMRVARAALVLELSHPDVDGSVLTRERGEDTGSNVVEWCTYITGKEIAGTQGNQRDRDRGPLHHFRSRPACRCAESCPRKAICVNTTARNAAVNSCH